ncbi:FxSxx-COOH system tetratricopeptide repeat protein [Streptomyces tanashiensis]|uniref:FxSxx-COOH system tetratricopeptide repeat protein n=1 Tax=Streptomyces tanashiensis TaxID=67367 RepID=UPI003409B66C
MQTPPGELRPVRKVAAPPGLTNLPVRHGVFVGRTRELKHLDAVLDGAGTAVAQAVHGLGGVGKSALAAHWAFTRARRHNPVWWITAGTPADLDTGLAKLAAALQPALAHLPQDQLRERAVQWLGAHSGWLLVLDNVDDPAVVRPLLARAVDGRVLITSRRASGWHDIATPVALDVLTPESSLDLLTGILARDGVPADLDGAERLCAELGHLPLALEQAGAYIAEARLNPRAYLRLLADHPADMYREAGEGHGRDRTVDRVWRITLDRLSDTPLAGEALRALAWYAPDGIPRTLLDPLGTPPAVHGAVRRLAAYSMITLTGDTISVHRLVQALARTPDPEDPHRRLTDIAHARDRAAAHLHTALPAARRNPATWPTWRSFLPHIEALADHTSPATDTAVTATLLNQAGLFLHGQGRRERATPYLERALEDRVRLLGTDHPDTLTARGNLGMAYESTGDTERAVPLYQQVCEDRARVLGAEHEDTLTARNNLAGGYESAGDLDKAVQLYEQTLSDMTRVLGADHPETLTLSDNLAGCYELVGDPDRALRLYRRTLDARIRVLGADHEDTLSTRNNLAVTYLSAGDPARALPLQEQTLSDRIRVLGADHPDTLGARSNLAVAYELVGDLARAIPQYQLAMAEKARVLGADHPDTLSAGRSLATAYELAGDLGRAVPLYRQTLDDRARVLGADHPDTLTARSYLAGAYAAAGDPARAVPLYRQTLDDRIRVLGADHEDTLHSYNQLANGHAWTGDLDRAVPLYRQALSGMTRVLGADHPDTRAVADNLATVLRSRFL